MNNFYLFFSLIIFYNQYSNLFSKLYAGLSFRTRQIWTLTFDNMKRLGFRSASLSTVEKVGAGTKPSQTTEPQLFYIVCWALPFILFVILKLINSLFLDFFNCCFSTIYPCLSKNPFAVILTSEYIKSLPCSFAFLSIFLIKLLATPCLW